MGFGVFPVNPAQKGAYLGLEGIPFAPLRTYAGLEEPGMQRKAPKDWRRQYGKDSVPDSKNFHIPKTSWCQSF